MRRTLSCSEKKTVLGGDGGRDSFRFFFFFFAVPNFFLSYSPRDTESCTAVLPSRDPSSPVQL